MTGWVVVHPLASLTVTVYDPAARLLNVPLAPKVTPSLENVYGLVPPEADTVTLPVEAPKQATLVWELIEAETPEAGWVIVTGWVVVQP